MAKNQVQKITVERLLLLLTKLRTETGFNITLRTVKHPVYKIILSVGLTGEFVLFGKALSTREAAMAIEMLILARQSNWKFPTTNPIVWAHNTGTALLIRY